MEVDADNEFWNSLELISTAADGFSDVFTSYLKSDRTGESHGTTDTACQVVSNQTLPITSIISRIQAEESDSEPDDGSHPPPTHTGGKWKPQARIDSQEIQTIENTVTVDTSSDDPHHTKHLSPTSEPKLADDDGEDVEEDAIPNLYCPICDKTFSRTDNITIHLTSNKHRSNITSDKVHLAAQLYTKYHTDLLRKAAYQCSCCTFAAVRIDDLLSHLKSQQHKANVSETVGPLECSECGFLDYNGTEMLLHCSTHNKSSIHSLIIKERKHKIACQQCDKVLHSTVHYSRHIRQQHSKLYGDDVKLKLCDYCPFKGKRATVNEHVSRKHRNHRPYLCKACQTDFHSKYDLLKHHKTKKHIGFVLENFRKTFTKQSSHKDIGSMTSHQTMRCKFCLYVTSDVSKLQLHYVSEHSESGPLSEENDMMSQSSDSVHSCHYCHKVFSSKSEHFIHEVTSHVMKEWTPGDESVELECFFCFDKISVREFPNHVIQHNPHISEAPVNFVRRDQAVKKQKNQSESSNQRYVCTETGCDKSYKSVSDLNVHRKSHTGEKKHVCGECNKRFPTNKQLKVHSLTHTTMLQYSCDYCNYKSKTRCHLLHHMRIHAGSKPYSCPYCEYSSTTIGNLRKHVLNTKKHKHLPMYECTVTGCHFVSDTVSQVSRHLSQEHGVINNKLMVKSTQNDWTDVLEGHSIIPTQH